MAANELDLLLNVITENEILEENCHKIVEAINTDTKTFLWLIEGLENSLTSNDLNLRMKGTEILSKVIINLPTEKLTESEISLVTTFLCAKLKDNHNLIPNILVGFEAIIKMQNCSTICIVEIVNGLSVDIHNQLPKHERRIIYQILNLLLNSKLSVIQQMGTAFIHAVISLVDSECNAKNLEYVFTFLPIMLSNFKLEHLAEDMFEVLSCYFPIETPVEGKDTVQREVLAELLETCLISNDEFAKYALPLLLEKLNSDLSTAKKDSLSLLSKACKTNAWNVLQLKPYLKELAFTLHREANKIDDIAMRSINAITDLVKNLSQNQEDIQIMDPFIEQLCKMNTHALQQVEMKNFISASQIVSSIARGSSIAALKVSNIILPILIHEYQNRPSEYKQQAVILAAITDLLSNLNITDLAKFQCMELYFNAITSPSNTELKHQGYIGFSRIAKILSQDERNNLYRLLSSALITPVVSVAAVHCLTSLCELYPNEILNNDLFEQLFNYKDNKCKLAMGALCSIGKQEPFLSKIAPRLINIITSNIEYVSKLSAIEGLQKLSTFEVSRNYLCIECNTIEVLTKYWLSNTNNNEITLEILNSTAILISSLFRSLNNEKQKFILEQCWEYFELNVLKDENCIILNSEAKAILGLGLISSLQPNVNLPSNLLNCLIFTAQSIENDVIRNSCGKSAACIINKLPTDLDVNYLIDTIMTDNKNFKYCISLFMRILRALLIKGYIYLNPWIEKIIQLVNDINLSNITTEAFPLILSEENNYVTVENNAQYDSSYKKTFTKYLTKFEEAHNICADNSKKSNFVLVITEILNAAPKESREQYLTNLLPILIRSLHNTDSSNNSLVLASLNCIKPLLMDKSVYIVQYLTDLINPCVSLSVTNQQMNIRIIALECLSFIPDFELPEFISLKSDVIFGIRTALDDKKRFVRNAAVKASGKWHQLGSPD